MITTHEQQFSPEFDCEPAEHRRTLVIASTGRSGSHMLGRTLRQTGAFGFPLFRADKRGIERESRAAGWDDIMEMTWFCHRPVRGKPCGLCAPCVYTIEEGLARRVPWPRRVLSFFYRRFVLPWKGPLRQLRLVTRGTRERPPPEPDLGA